MKIEVLGPGCARCQTLAANARSAVESLGLECEIVKVTDMNEIVSRGVMMTPALAIDGALKTIGKVTSVPEIRALVAEASE
jgi:small redox-active disulfide protein 2